MACFSNVGFAVICIIVFWVWVASARPYSRKQTEKITLGNRSTKIPRWVRYVLRYFDQFVANTTIQRNANSGLPYGNYGNEQDNKLTSAENSLPVLIHKEEVEFGITITPSPLLDKDTVNPFYISKQIKCTTPANLPQIVKDLNKRLTAFQLVGLNPRTSLPPAIPVSQPDACPTSATGDWWPKPEDNLRSTCPWKLRQVDLGVNAFPRYVNTAVCLCTESCIGSKSMRCIEITYDVTYFNRTGCENGLAVMETSKYTVNIGCHCVSALVQTTIPNYNTQR